MLGFGRKKRRTMNEEEKKILEADTSGSAEQSSAAEPTSEEKAMPDENVPTEAGMSSEEEAASKAEETPEGETPPEAEKAPEAEVAPEAEPDWKDRYARTLADFDNYRKRMARDREELAQFAAKEVVRDLLPTVDNLALALDKAENKDDPFVQGVKLAYDGFLKALADHGATPIDSVGEPFDANYHEALAQLPSPDVAEGVVMNEVKRGWLLHGKLLRAAQVVVSSGVPEAPAEA